ncbi:hypothetical protein AAG747_28225 [Rapidithrix thailandica]|uniref:Uncharacterized protein n=1 Tax=Rapidithrix thailandica TaxID=413964 RepID=A0AAW9SFJ9_9BACT
MILDINELFQLAKTDLHPHPLSHLDKAQLDVWLKVVEKEIRKIKQSLEPLPKEKKLKKSIRGLVQTMDLLISYDREPSLQPFYHALLKMLDQLLTALRSDPSSTLDEKAPELHRKTLIHASQEILQSFNQPDIPIQHLLTQPFRELPLKSVYSFQQMDYLRSLLPHLLTNLLENNEDQLLQSVIQYNLNSLGVYQYFSDKFSTELEALETTQGKLGYLAYHYKTLSQLPVLPEMEYKKKNPPLKEWICHWLAVEISYRLFSQSTVPHHSSKLQVGLSVPQLAYLFKLFMKSGIISTENTMETLRTVINTFSTQKTKVISLESLRRKFYDSDEGAKNQVKALLQQLLKIAQQQEEP